MNGENEKSRPDSSCMPQETMEAALYDTERPGYLERGLDVTTSLIVRELLLLLAKSGKAIFFASPIVELFEKVCTHVPL